MSGASNGVFFEQVSNLIHVYSPLASDYDECMHALRYGAIASSIRCAESNNFFLIFDGRIKLSSEDKQQPQRSGRVRLCMGNSVHVPNSAF